MRFDNLQLRTKLFIPACVSVLMLLGAVGFAGLRFHAIIADAQSIITQRDVALTKLLRANNRVYRAQKYAYLALTADAESEAGKMAAKGFRQALDEADSYYKEAADLLPEERAQIETFRKDVAGQRPKLVEAYELARKSPGLDRGADLKPEDFAGLAKIAKMLEDVSVQLERLINTVVAFNRAQTEENARRAADLAANTSWVFWQIEIGGLLAALATGGLTYWISTAKVARPLMAIVAAMKSLASGALDVEVPGRERQDEVGDMAVAVQAFKESGIERVRLEREAAHARQLAEAEKACQAAAKEEEARKLETVVSELATGLVRLSEGKLTYRIAPAFPPEYERLKTDFNAAIGRLQHSLGVVASNTIAIRSGTKNMSTAADDLSRRTEQQAANLEETAAALGQINETVRRTSAGARQARDLVLAARREAEVSGDVVQRAVGAMGDISDSSGKISQIIGVIDEIAFQTNLLALNAGVEAARAGEAGRGFAVVASEVRALAQRSAGAAKEIKALIRASSDQVHLGVELVDKTGEALTKIMSSIGAMSDIISQIAQSSEEQAASLDEVNTAVRQLDQVTQQNAAMVEESTAASKGVATESDELAQLISGFDVGAPGASADLPIARRPEPQRVGAPPRKRVVNARPAPASDGWDEF